MAVMQGGVAVRVGWFVKRWDGKILTIDKKWVDAVSSDCIKYYTSGARALRYGLAGLDGPRGRELDGTAFAVYPGSTVSPDGHVCDATGKMIRYCVHF